MQCGIWLDGKLSERTGKSCFVLIQLFFIFVLRLLDKILYFSLCGVFEIKIRGKISISVVGVFNFVFGDWVVSSHVILIPSNIVIWINIDIKNNRYYIEKSDTKKLIYKQYKNELFIKLKQLHQLENKNIQRFIALIFKKRKYPNPIKCHVSPENAKYI